MLREVASLQQDFRSRDLDKNGVPDYWRKDIAGLCLIQGTSLTYAFGDDRAVSAIPSNSVLPFAPDPGSRFWVRAIRFQDEKEPDPNRFAACCFPTKYGTGIRSHYIISHEGIIYKKDLGHGNGIEVYPADPVKEGWKKLD